MAELTTAIPTTMNNIKLTGCSLGCAYAEGSLATCECICKGERHGQLSTRPVFAKCSPAAEKRCKSGEEGGECKCSCFGQNHALYRHIAAFEEIRIVGMVA